MSRAYQPYCAPTSSITRQLAAREAISEVSRLSWGKNPKNNRDELLRSFVRRHIGPTDVRVRIDSPPQTRLGSSARGQEYPRRSIPERVAQARNRSAGLGEPTTKSPRSPDGPSSAPPPFSDRLIAPVCIPIPILHYSITQRRSRATWIRRTWEINSGSQQMANRPKYTTPQTATHVNRIQEVRSQSLARTKTAQEIPEASNTFSAVRIRMAGRPKGRT